MHPENNIMRSLEWYDWFYDQVPTNKYLFCNQVFTFNARLPLHKNKWVYSVWISLMRGWGERVQRYFTDYTRSAQHVRIGALTKPLKV